MEKNKWPKEQYIQALELYAKLKRDKQKMQADNSEIQALATSMQRTASSVAMRLQNFEYYATGGESGLRNGSKMCATVFDEKYKELGLDPPKSLKPSTSKISDHSVSPDLLQTISKVNEIVVNIAMKVNDVSMIKSDNVNLFDSLMTLSKYLNAESFTLKDLITLSAVVKSIPDYPNDLLSSTLKSTLSESEYNKYINLIKIFK